MHKLASLTCGVGGNQRPIGIAQCIEVNSIILLHPIPLTCQTHINTTMMQRHNACDMFWFYKTDVSDMQGHLVMFVGDCHHGHTYIMIVILTILIASQSDRFHFISWSFNIWLMTTLSCSLLTELKLLIDWCRVLLVSCLVVVWLVEWVDKTYLMNI